MSNVALGKSIEEPITNPAAATDGQISTYTGELGFAEFSWPYMLTVNLGETYTLFCIRLLLWDGLGQGNKQRDNRSYKYRLLTSVDHQLWKVVFDGSSDGTNGWQVFNFPDSLEARYIRIHGIWNSANAYFQVVQVEAYDGPSPELEAEIVLQRTVFAESIQDEIGDGLPLQAKVGSIINRIERLVEDNELLNPEPFRQLISQLRNQVSDVASLERGMDSIRREIIAPVRHELEQSAKLGRFSVWGFWVGLVGGGLAILSLVLAISQGLADQQVKVQADQAVATSSPSPSNKRVDFLDLEDPDKAPKSFSVDRKLTPFGTSRFTRHYDIWVQEYANGDKAQFPLTGRILLNGCLGSLLYRIDNLDVEIFVPDKGCPLMKSYARIKKQKWDELGRMENIQ